MVGAIADLVGREAELAQLSQLLTADADHALVLSGEPGIGKTALLERVSARAVADGWRVVRVLGVEAEEAFALGGLNQLVFNLPEIEPRLDDRDREVLAPVFGAFPDAPIAVLPLVSALLKLLAVAAESQPVLLLIDDVHWLDSVSSHVLSAIGRRLAHPRLRALVSRRIPYQSVFSTAGWRELELAPLNGADSAQLFDRAELALSATARSAILTAAAGNPLALTELPRCSEGLGGCDHLSAMPLTERLVEVFGGRLDQLDAVTRAELLRAALDGSATGSIGVDRGRYVMRNVQPAVEAGLLLSAGSGKFSFRHPLVRAAVVRRSSPVQCRDAHLDLAGLYADELVPRAVHLAAAATRPDEEVAGLLLQAAKLSGRRGDLGVAVNWLRKAAELTADPVRRAALFGDATFVAVRAGLLDDTPELLGSSRARLEKSSSATLALAYRKFHRDGDVVSTHQELLEALEGAEILDDKTVNRMAHLLLSITSYSGNARKWDQTNAVLEVVKGRVNPSVLMYRTAEEHIANTAGAIRAGLHRYAERLPMMHSRQVMLVAFPAYCIDALADFRDPLTEAFQHLSQHGASIDVIEAGRVVMLDLIATGRWARAAQVGGNCVEMAQLPQGSRLRYHQFLADLGLLAAARGDLETARQYAAQVSAWSMPRGLERLLDAADRIAVRVALAEADYRAAYQAALRISEPGRHLRRNIHEVVDDMLDLVEASVNSGYTADARQYADSAMQLRFAAISPRAESLTIAMAAMTAPDNEADRLYRTALGHPGITDFPFEYARVALAHGRWLRRRRRWAEARGVLALANGVFARLGAVPWVNQAEAELIAAGAQPERTRDGSAPLSAQELRIAELAVQGQTTKGIAVGLCLSPRTVDTHLYRIFRKLGITKRAELRAALYGRSSAPEIDATEVVATEVVIA